MKQLIFNGSGDKHYVSVWAYVDDQKHKVGYAYLTRNGNLCIKGNKLMDKTKLGNMLTNGLYLECEASIKHASPHEPQI